MSRFCLKAIKGLLLVLAAVKAHQTGSPVLMKTPLFQIVGGFANDNYWSSSEFDNNNAWNQNFSKSTEDLREDPAILLCKVAVIKLTHY